MKKYFSLALLAALLMTTGLSAPAMAKEMRWPQTGDAFVTFNLPDDWGTKIDAQHNTIDLRPALMTKETLQTIAIGYEERKPVALTGKNFKDIVESILGGLNTDKVHTDAFGSRKTVPISGFKWDRFTTDIVSNKITLHASIYLCADESRIMSLAFMNAGPRFSDKELRILRSVRVSGMKACSLNAAK